jgi:transposase
MARIIGSDRRHGAILDVMARRHGAIGVEICSIDQSILAWHRSYEASRRLEEIPGIGPGHDDVMQTRSFRGSGEPAWVIAL